MLNIETYNNWDFENVWGKDEDGLPYLLGRKDSRTIANLPSTTVDSTIFDGVGEGTEENPFQISTKEQLMAIEQMNLKGLYHYKIMNDIDLGDIENFEPIGQWKKIDAVIDGNEHVISNLTIKNPSANFVGLFTYLNSGSIKKLGLEGVDIEATSNRNIASLAGYMEYNASLDEVYAKGQIRIGTGYSYGSVGGLVGENSYFSSPRIDNSYTNVNIIGEGNTGLSIGGIAGKNSAQSGSAYSLSKIQVEKFSAYNAIQNEIWSRENVEKELSQPKGAYKRTQEMTKKRIYKNWDFDNVWSMDEGNNFPYLFGKSETAISINDFEYSELEGEGTEEKPYLISTAQEFQSLINTDGRYSYYRIKNNIDIGEEIPNFEYFARGVYSPFKGTIDGNGCKISNINIEVNNGDYYIGLFGYFGGTIKKLEIENININVINNNNTSSNIGAVTGAADGRNSRRSVRNRDYTNRR